MSVTSKTSRSDLSNTTQRPVVKKVTQRSTATTSNVCSSTMLCCVALMFVILLGISGAALGLSIYNYMDLEPVRANMTHVSELSTVIMSDFDPIDLLAVHDVCKITVACESTDGSTVAHPTQLLTITSVSDTSPGVRFSLTSKPTSGTSVDIVPSFLTTVKGISTTNSNKELLFNNLFLKKACALPDDDDEVTLTFIKKTELPVIYKDTLECLAREVSFSN